MSPATAWSDFRDDAGQPVSPMVRAQAQALRGAQAEEDNARFMRRMDRSRVRREAARCPDDASFVREDGGSPLGPGYPSGAPLRQDGESHSDAWRRILRADVCAYCGKDGGTVDHVVPRSRRTAGLERWTNLVGACASCNSAKGARDLLDYLLVRKLNARSATHAV